MATLSETTNSTRKFFVGCFVIVLLFIFGNFVLNLIKTSICVLTQQYGILGDTELVYQPISQNQQT
jgi:hypothetical protein